MKLIRIEEKDYGKEIFRIFPMQWFLEVLEQRRLTFVKPKLWKDPMDRLIFEYYFRSPDREGIPGDCHDDYFAQCWTLKYESQSLWSEYAPLHDGVRVKTTIGKLVDLLKRHPLNHDEHSWFMGQVDYLPIDEIKKWIGKSLPYNDVEYNSPLGQAHTLLIKLHQYSHEQEVRIIFNCKGNNAIQREELFGDIEIDPLQLFDKLLLDPRMPENIYDVYREKFIEYGFRPDAIVRSELYDEELLRQKLLQGAR